MKKFITLVAAGLLTSTLVWADDAARPVGNPNDVLQTIRANPDQSIDIIENPRAEQIVADQINQNATTAINNTRYYKPSPMPRKKLAVKMKVSKKKTRTIIYKTVTRVKPPKAVHKAAVKKPSTWTKRKVKRTKNIT